MSDLDLSAAVDQLARELASLEPDDPWPSNADLGGGPCGTRDDEYRHAMYEQARDHLLAVAPLIAEQVRAQAAAEIEAYTDAVLDIVDTQNGARLAFIEIIRIAREGRP